MDLNTTLQNFIIYMYESSATAAVVLYNKKAQKFPRKKTKKIKKKLEKRKTKNEKKTEKKRSRREEEEGRG